MAQTDAQVVIDGHIEQSQIAMVLSQFLPDTDRPDMFRLTIPVVSSDAEQSSHEGRLRIDTRFYVGPR